MRLEATISETVIHTITVEIDVSEDATDDQITELIEDKRTQTQEFKANDQIVCKCISYDDMSNYTEKIWIEYTDPRSNEVISYES